MILSKDNYYRKVEAARMDTADRTELLAMKVFASTSELRATDQSRPTLIERCSNEKFTKLMQIDGRCDIHD